MALDSTTILVATQAFVRELRREFDRRKPEGPNPVPLWDKMRPIDQKSFLRCVTTALAASTPEHVQKVSAGSP